MPIDMESFGRPLSVDYYVGRRVENVVGFKPVKDDKTVWEIRLEGGAVIRNYDKKTAMPKAIKGAALSMVILNGGRVSGQPVTELRFGLEVVLLNPMHYTIQDDVYTEGAEVWAQRSAANDYLNTPPHPDERIAEGPTGEEPDAA